MCRAFTCTPIDAFRLWFGRPPAREFYRETTTAVMEAMDAAELYRQGEGESAQSMSPDDVSRWMELVDKAGPIIERAEVEDREWERFAAGLEVGEGDGDDGGEVLE